MFACASCKLKHTDGPVCSACRLQYDFGCAGISENGYRKLGERKNVWRCPTCKSGSSPSLTSTSPMPTQLDRIQEQLNQIAFQLVPLKTLIEDVKIIKTEVSDLKVSVEMAHDTMENLTKTVADLDARVSHVERIADLVPALQDEIIKLNQDIEDRDQWARANNVEIRGIPLKKNENLYEFAQRIGELCDYPVRREDINYIARIPTRIAGAEKSIVIAFNNRYIKENLVASARKCKQLTLSNLGFAASGPVYVNDHLTLKNKTLLNKARTLAREKDFRYIWVKHSKIMARKSDTSPIFLIKNEKDLTKII
ncbi:uncharacterized protein LOC132902526 [Amyelois transitella]|uniref:uncharacterized protein LOC132902526 n=1 Tax=Amyelois transitella TaxID=680683 RepID=UPI002990399D|nr:uncharacterized protein LOC132902526 [Amyelois transitella]